MHQAKILNMKYLITLLLLPSLIWGNNIEKKRYSVIMFYEDENGKTQSKGRFWYEAEFDDNNILIKLYDYKGEYHKCYDIEWFNPRWYGTQSGQIYEYMLNNKMSELCVLK